MGYERKSMQILGGGFNLLPPPDKVPTTDYLIAQNWRVDREGKLVSRPGYVQSNIWSGWLDSQYLHSGAVFGGDIYWAGNDAGGSGYVYFDANEIGSGLSGNRVGMVPFLGWMWIMDQSGAFRHNAANGRRAWLISPPTTAPGAFAGAAGTETDGPLGTYTFYYTYQTTDGFEESNPSPPSPTVTLDGTTDPIVQVWASTDPTVGNINVYASGGTLGDAYLIATVDNLSSVIVFNATDQASNTANHPQLAPPWNDLSATNDGITMPTTHDPPPAAAGMTGPYFDRLIAWNAFANGALRVNRLFWTDPGQPQYWPGSNEPQGNWVDVGADGEMILWCTAHANVLVIYKERSIWWMVGDPDTGYLEAIDAGTGLANPWAVAQAGQMDYFAGPNGLYSLTLNPTIQEISQNIQPIFNTNANYNGPLSPPGAMRNARPTPFSFYDVSLGWGMGKLYVSYWEKGGGQGVLLVTNGQRWMYHRSALQQLRFYGFLFTSGAIGAAMWGLTGGSSGGTVFNVDDFEGNYTADGSNPIECVYQSHYENCGLPDNQKVWLEAVIDYEFAGDTAAVYIGLDGGDAQTGTPLTLITHLTGNGRVTASVPLGIDKATGGIVQRDQGNQNQTDGVLAKNLSVAIDVNATGLVIIHNVYLYYYVEARLALQVSSIPVDFGSGQVKQVKELELDIDASLGPAIWNLYSDLPGNALAIRQTQPIQKGGGRAVIKYPFPVTEGFLWRLAVNAGKVHDVYGNPFRIYSARLLMRVMGTYVEGYESAAGFCFDTMEQTFESGLTHVARQFQIALAASPIKRFREVSMEIDTRGGNVTMSFLTDLPGNVQAVRFTKVINTGSAGRRFVRIPLPAGINPPIEGRLCRMQFCNASANFILYDLSVELLAIGVYIEAYEAQGGAVWDSREQDFKSQKPKEARELELDIETDPSAPVTVTLYCDLPGYVSQQAWQQTVTTTGRQAIKLPLTYNAIQSLYPMGRWFRVIITGANAFRLYGCQLRVREFGQYLTGDEASGGGVWDSTPLDLGSERIKAYKRIEFDLQTDGTNPVTVTVLTEQSGTLAVVYTYTLNTQGKRLTLVNTLPPGTRGRLIQVIVSGQGVRLYAGRVWARMWNDPQAQWDWGPLPIQPTEPAWADAAMPINPTPPGGEPAQWWWAKVLSVTDTPDTWQWIDMSLDLDLSERMRA